ncbi:hypothetical protein, partial [Anabaena sp. UHCC 0204]
MYYSHINTPAEILDAFNSCKYPGEQLDLFEGLAMRSDPPISAFWEILKGIKLEPILALTIQAFGKISDIKVKTQLQNSRDLLDILGQFSKFGSSDLIRWSATKAISQIGFSFLIVSQVMQEKPEVLCQELEKRIVQQLEQKSREQNFNLGTTSFYYWIAYFGEVQNINYNISVFLFDSSSTQMCNFNYFSKNFIFNNISTIAFRFPTTFIAEVGAKISFKLLNLYGSLPVEKYAKDNYSNYCRIQNYKCWIIDCLIQINAKDIIQKLPKQEISVFIPKIINFYSGLDRTTSAQYYCDYSSGYYDNKEIFKKIINFAFNLGYLELEIEIAKKCVVATVVYEDSEIRENEEV